MRFRNRLHAASLLAIIAGFWGSVAIAQTINISENFNSATTANPWYAFGGACLTAGTSTSSSGSGNSATAASPPSCVAIASSYYKETLVGGYNGVSGSGQTLPDPNNYGALRFTNGCINGSYCSSSGGHNQNGAIISGNSYSSNAGIQITFKTTTYRGDSDNGDGADGMSFFLIDAGTTAAPVAPNIGSFGGSLGYTCSNKNGDYHGMIGGYIGLGIDEFGNFLNAGDNTVTGPSYQANRIGLRGAGSVAWPWLLANYPQYYSSTTPNQTGVVQGTCSRGYLTDGSGASITGTNSAGKPNPVQSIYDYTAIPNASKVLTNVSIANEYKSGGYARTNATPIMYRLKITPDGLLSFAYNINGAAWQGILTNQLITSSNPQLPTNIRFGFAGSTGGGSNIHEVLCFKAASLDTANGSAGSNLVSSQVTSSSQVYFALYNPNDWTGQLAAYALGTDSTGAIAIGAPAWDASCVLTGLATSTTICPTTGATGPTPAQDPTSRVILTWNGSPSTPAVAATSNTPATPAVAGTPGTSGIPFEYANLTSTQQGVIDYGDATMTPYRVSFLRGDRSQEVTANGGLYRDRDNVLGDIVDSSPTPVGQPVLSYGNTWTDKLYTSTSMPENSGSQNYTQYYIAERTRQNVVYVGANDGMLHGFRAGAYTSANAYDASSNDGREVIAYMPAAVVSSIHNYSDVSLDYSNSLYGHNFYVDATPGTGDLFYGGAWHTWLVSGLGAGGASIFALDITDPTKYTESTANAASVVIGEWFASSITCVNVSPCGANLGNTYGTPVIRRLHNGNWAVIFGNGLGSSSGDAGIYVMTVDQSSGSRSFYYLGTGRTGTGDGIAYVNAVDLDADHVTDYVYAGDVQGNVWRFDLTSSSPSAWAAGSAPVFSAGSSQPITSNLVIASVTDTSGTRVMVAFGTGQQTPVTNSTPTTYSTAAQSLYAFWDWNFTGWNGKSTLQYASLNSASSNFGSTTGLSAPYTMTPSNLTAQSLTLNSVAKTVDLTSTPICWVGTTICSGSDKSFGWDAALPSTHEQIIFNPELIGTAFVVNSLIPAQSTALDCSTSLNTGYTYAISLATGGLPGTTSSTTTAPNTNNFFYGVPDTLAAGTMTNATGTSLVATTGVNATGITCTGNCELSPSTIIPAGSGCTRGSTALVYQTSSGTSKVSPITPSCPLTGQRVNWTQKR